jgi:gliding motility-associated-like protein
VTLHQIVVTDPKTGLNALIEVLAPGGSSEYTQSHTVTQEDLDNGFYINTARADGFTPSNTPIGATDDATVNESANTIDAVDDNTGTIVGVDQITPNVINVFSNDTLNTAAVNPADVILTTVTPNTFLQLNPDGSIDVLPNAPVGPQTLIYQICEKVNNTNCDTATVTLTIEAPSMTVSGEGICINDVPYFNYTTTANNFTPVNGLTLTWTDSNNNVVSTMTNLPLNGKVLWPGATVDQNGNGTDWPGWVLQGNKWIEAADGFENTRPTALVTFTLNPDQTIIVNYPPSDPFCTSRPTFAIDAVNDTANTAEGLHGATNVANVLNNDTLNTEAVNPAAVTLSVLVPDPNGAISLNTDGSVDVKANTPTGTYTLTYQICEIADAGNCDTAVVTINVVNIPFVIQATSDTFSVTQCSIIEGIRNALSNDLLNGVVANPADFKFKLLTALGQYITIDDQGNITFIKGVAAGQYSFDYQICEAANPTNCSTATITINVAGIESVTITVPENQSPCNADTTPVDLFSFLPQGTPTDGIWVDTDNTGRLNANIFDPFGISISPVNTYHFEYKIAGDCPKSIFLVMDINDDCKVLPCKTIIVHNAFSSNEDGRNDYFQIENLEDNDCYRNIRLEVFNRWGVLVFEKDNYNNEGNAFRGYSEGRTTINKREGLPTGTYFYILSYETSDGLGKAQSVRKDGYLYLIK